MNLQLNGACRRDIRTFGIEKTPVITIDDPIVSTKELVDYANRVAVFGSSSDSAYPGIRAELPDIYARVLAPELIALVAHQYGLSAEYRPHLIHKYFSLVTTDPEGLEPLQRMPHTDNRSQYYFATVHYLNDGSHGGTGFFRHRPTGFERITEDRYDTYKQEANSHMAGHGLPPRKYINASDDHFELIGAIQHRANRMVIYPGNLLHSGLISPDRDIDPDPLCGRLTANLFILFTPT